MDPLAPTATLAAIVLAAVLAWAWRLRSAIRLAQRNHQLNRERLYKCLAGVQDLVCLLDTRGRFRFVNEHYARVLGYPEAEILGRLPSEIGMLPPGELEMIRSKLAEVLVLGSVPPVEHHLISRSGERHLFESRATVFTDPSRLSGLVVISRCIELQRQTEEQLHRTTALHKLLVDNSLIGLALTRQGRIQWVNPRLAALLHSTPAALQSLAVNDLMETSLGSPEAFRALAMPVLESGDWFDQEVEVFLKTGSSFWARIVARALDPSAPLEGVLFLVEDITARRQAEGVVRQAQKLESLGLLAGSIAHDFNNLLTAILGNLSLGQRHLPRNCPATDYLDRAEKTVLQASDLTRQMLAYSGRGHFVVRPHDLNQVVQEVARLLHATLSKKIHLCFDLAPGLPLFQADAAQIHQVILNLVTNAADAIGVVEGTITISTRVADLSPEETTRLSPGGNLRGGPSVILCVRDTGCGMSREVVERIFDPFFTTKARGRGLGLSAMQGILRGHHAGIRVLSEPGRGSCFEVYFPVDGEVLLQSPPEPELPEESFTGRVLLVDDEPLVLETAASTLKSLGFQVTLATDGLEALELFRETPEDFALVLMDITMPRMDGKEAFEAMRAIRADIPIILCSGYTDLDSIQQPLGSRQTEFLPKPYQMRDLQRVIRFCLA
nr:response regulator [uncultured Holophaga sp.]